MVSETGPRRAAGLAVERTLMDASPVIAAQYPTQAYQRPCPAIRGRAEPASKKNSTPRKKENDFRNTRSLHG